MRKTKELLIVFIFSLLASLLFLMSVNKIYANTKNEVTLNFEGATIEDKAAFYPDLGRILLLKDDVAIDITNNMKIDLNEAKYEIQVIGYIYVGDPDDILNQSKIMAIINDWKYGLKQNCGIIELDTNKYSGTLNIKLQKYDGVHINTRVENVYSDITSTGTIDLTNSKEYVIDFSKNDEFTNGLKTFADLEKTIYYRKDNDSLIATENENEAVIKIVGNEDDNKAILTAINIGDKKEEQFKGLHTKYTGSKLQYEGTIENIINETRTDYYTRCTYDFTFKYVGEEKKQYEFIEGANQIYIIDESKNASFRINADYNLFVNRVYVDNKLLDTTNYDSKSGSTIITLNDEYLKTLSVGEHILKVAFSDNGEAVTKFEIKEKKQNIEENTEKDSNIQKESNNANPKTGDNVTMYFLLSTMCILGIVTLVIINNRKNKEIGGKKNEN